MTIYRVEPTDEALVDAGDAYFWLNEQSEGAAFRWYEGLMKAFRPPEGNPVAFSGDGSVNRIFRPCAICR